MDTNKFIIQSCINVSFNSPKESIPAAFLNELIVFSIALRLPTHPLWSIHLTVVFVSQSVDKIGENNVVESSIKKFLIIFSSCFVLYNFGIMKKIEISDELYSKIEEAYAEVKRNKDKIPPVVYAKYGNSFDSFVEHILNDFIESAKRTQRFQKTFNDMMKDFDVSKLQDELSSLSSLFGLDKEKQKDKEENKSSDPEKTKN